MNDKDLQKIKKRNTQLAHDLAKEKGFNDAQELLERTSAEMDSPNLVKATRASQRATDFTAQLSLLILYQTIVEDRQGNKDGWTKFFNDEYISAGNSKQWIKNIRTGATTFDSNQFVPTKKTNPVVEVVQADMYKIDAQGNKTLADGAYQFKKPLTISEPEWLPYFKSGKLGEFISRITDLMRQTYDDYIVMTLQRLIKNMRFDKTETDTTNMNMYDCLSNKVFPMLTRMQYKNTEYNINYDGNTQITSKNIDPVSREDILVFMNSNNESRLRSGILARLFNAKLVKMENHIPEENFIGTAGELNVGDEDTPISISNDWLDENTIIAISKNAIRHCFQIDRAESQYWAENMTIQLNLHIWGVIKVLYFEKGFKYTCTNLSVLPN